jgi:hypothetical protein
MGSQNRRDCLALLTAADSEVSVVRPSVARRARHRRTAERGDQRRDRLHRRGLGRLHLQRSVTQLSYLMSRGLQCARRFS